MDIGNQIRVITVEPADTTIETHVAEPLRVEAQPQPAPAPAR